MPADRNYRLQFSPVSHPTRFHFPKHAETRKENPHHLPRPGLAKASTLSVLAVTPIKVIPAAPVELAHLLGDRVGLAVLEGVVVSAPEEGGAAVLGDTFVKFVIAVAPAPTGGGGGGEEGEDEDKREEENGDVVGRVAHLEGVCVWLRLKLRLRLGVFCVE